MDFYRFVSIVKYVGQARENKLYQIFEKGQQWLEAYEEHLATGKLISEILAPMEPTEEELQEEERLQAEYERCMKKIDEEILGRK